MQPHHALCSTGSSAAGAGRHKAWHKVGHKGTADGRTTGWEGQGHCRGWGTRGAESGSVGKMALHGGKLQSGEHKICNVSSRFANKNVLGAVRCVCRLFVGAGQGRAACAGARCRRRVCRSALVIGRGLQQARLAIVDLQGQRDGGHVGRGATELQHGGAAARRAGQRAWQAPARRPVCARAQVRRTRRRRVPGWGRASGTSPGWPRWRAWRCSWPWARRPSPPAPCG